MSQAPALPTPDRRSALRYLLTAANYMDINFFKPSRVVVEGEDHLSYNFFGNILEVRKRTVSDAEPANVAYEIRLGDLMPSTLSRPLLVYVMLPKADKVANRTAFKYCLDELSNNPSQYIAEKQA